MAKKKILICGATGFIGRNCAEYFARSEEYEVYGTYYEAESFHDPRVTMIRADLTKKEEVDGVVKGMDIIVQAAAVTSGAKDIVNRPYLHVTDNAVMNSLILRSAYDNKISHVVFFSCTVMYQSSDALIRESDFDANAAMVPSYFGVGWTKVYIEKMCEFYSRISKTKFTVIRHSNIYGPYDKYDLDRSHVFGATITKVMQAAGDAITVWGEGKEKRDLLYVSDLVRFVEQSLVKQETVYELFNVGYGSAVAIRDLVRMIIDASGKKLDIHYDTSKPTIPTQLALDCSKARNMFGWHPEVTLADGIMKTLEWYSLHIRL